MTNADDDTVVCPVCGSSDTSLDYYHEEGGPGAWGRFCHACKAASEVSDFPYYGAWDAEDLDSP